MRSNSGDSCCEAALQHQGLVLQPSFLVGAHLQSGALVEVLPQFRSIELGIYAVYPSRKQLSAKVCRQVDFLVEAFQRPVWPIWTTADVWVFRLKQAMNEACPGIWFHE